MLSYDLLPLISNSPIKGKRASGSESLWLGDGVRSLADKDLVGKVSHYYDKIGVAVIALTKSIKLGDELKFVHGDNSFKQTVESMQLEHEQITSGKKGQEIAVKIDKVAKPGTQVYLE